MSSKPWQSKIIIYEKTRETINNDGYLSNRPNIMEDIFYEAK